MSPPFLCPVSASESSFAYCIPAICTCVCVCACVCARCKVVAPRRLVTFFVYLNSLPNGAGGHTEFPLLKLKVQTPNPEPRTPLFKVNMGSPLNSRPENLDPKPETQP